MPETIDFLIVGNGLAGSLLAWLLLQRRNKVVIVDQDIGTSASLTAAGLINPITGKRFVKDPSFEVQVESAKNLYRILEKYFARRFYFEKSLVRIFQSKEEASHWRKRRFNRKYEHYIVKNYEGDTDIHGINSPFGGYYQSYCGYLDTASLIEQIGRYCHRTNRLISAEFNTKDLSFTKRRLFWKNYSLKQIIFCEGYRAIKNPFFAWLPFQPSKGEVLNLRTQSKLSDEIIHWGHWLIPVGNSGLCKVGTTYQRQYSDEYPSASTTTELLNSVSKLFANRVSFEFISSKAGIRPNTLDKAPFLGRHPQFSNLSIFNGFGSKGALLIPWYADRYADSLLNQQPPPAEADIARYQKKYFPG